MALGPHSAHSKHADARALWWAPAFDAGLWSSLEMHSRVAGHHIRRHCSAHGRHKAKGELIDSQAPHPAGSCSCPPGTPPPGSLLHLAAPAPTAGACLALQWLGLALPTPHSVHCVPPTDPHPTEGSQMGSSVPDCGLMGGSGNRLCLCSVPPLWLTG